MSLGDLLSYLGETEKWFVAQTASKSYAAIDSNLRLEGATRRLQQEKMPLLKHGPLDEQALARLSTAAFAGAIPNDSWRKLVALVKQAAASEKAANETLAGTVSPRAAWRDDDPGRHDVLLPIGSKKCYDEDIEEAVREALTDAPLALLVIDVDDFKGINENHGHEAGNDVLRAIARVTTSSASGKGKAYRWGGDELAVLLPNHALPEAAAVAERIRLGVEKLDFSSPELRATITVGCAMLPEGPDRTPRGLFERADAVLRSAKREGKNRVAGSLAEAVPPLKSEAPAPKAAGNPGQGQGPKFKAPFYFAPDDESPLCPRCWEVEKIQVHLQGPFRVTGLRWDCPNCKETYLVQTEEERNLGPVRRRPRFQR